MKMFGIDFFDSDKAALAQRLKEGVKGGEKLSLAFCELNMLGEYLVNPVFSRKLNRFDLVMADGSVILLLKRLFASNKGRLERIPGPDFFKYLLEDDNQHSHYFLGSSEATLQKLEERLLTVNPQLNIKGSFSPPFEKEFSEETKRGILDRVNSAGADFLWVSFGCPKQERWIYEHYEELNASVVAGVGAAFDFHSGRVQRAPFIFRKLGLEFAFRIFTQPRIIWRVVKGVSRIVPNLGRIKS